MRASSSSGTRAVPARDQPPHGALDAGIARSRQRARPRARRTSRGSRSRARSRSWSARRSKRSAVARGRPEREAHRGDPQADGHAVRADARGAVDDEPAQELAVGGREARGEAAAQRVGDEHRRARRRSAGAARRASRANAAAPRTSAGGDAPSPGRSGTITRWRSARPGDHRRPHRAAALDAAVQQDERRALPALEHGRRRAGRVQPALRQRQVRAAGGRARRRPSPGAPRGRRTGGDRCGVRVHAGDATPGLPAPHRRDHPFARAALGELRRSGARARTRRPRCATRRRA